MVAEAIALALVLGLLPAQDAKPPAAEVKKLRQAFAEALADGSGKSDGKAVALAKSLQSKYALDELIAALRQGPLLDAKSVKPRKVGKQEEKLAKFGPTTVGYTFAFDDLVLRYAVDVPAGYDPDMPAPLLVDPGHGSGADEKDEGKAGFLEYYRNQVDEAKLKGWLIARTEILEQIGADGKRGAKPEDQVARAFQLFFRDVASRFAIDPDRVYVAGLSQTGFWAWYLGRSRADRLAGIAPMAAVTWEVDGYLDNYRALPAFVLHGSDDKICPVAQPRKTCAALKELGFPVKYEELAGAGHDFGTFGELDRALAWLAKTPRDPYPKHVSKSLCTEQDPWCYWLRVDELEKEGGGQGQDKPTARIEGVVEGQKITLTSKGVKRASVCLARELVDLDQPVEIVWNQKSVHSGKIAPVFATAVALALEKADWKGTFVAQVALKAP